MRDDLKAENDDSRRPVSHGPIPENVLSPDDVFAAVRRLEFDPDLEALNHRMRSGGTRAARADDPAGQGSSGLPLPAEMRELSLQLFAQAEDDPTPPLTRPVAPTGIRPRELAHRSVCAPLPDIDAPPDAAEIAFLAKDSPSPRLAASLAIFVPGLGHLYAGEAGVAAIIIPALVAPLLIARSLLRSVMSGGGANGAEPGAQLIVAILALFAAGAVLAASVRDAWRVTAALSPWGRPAGAPRPLLAATASALIPGWGQFLNDQAAKGTAFLSLLPVAAVAALLARGGGAVGQILADSLGLSGSPGLRVLAGFATAAVLLAWMASVCDAWMTAAGRRS